MSVHGFPVQEAAVVVTVAVTLLFGWYVSETGRLRTLLTDRFVYGVPWGTVVTVVGVVAFYLFAQSGLQHWGDPVTVAFRNWAYRYTAGMLTSGFAHASPGHLLSNMIATVVFAPIAEFAWGHYPPETESEESDETERDEASVTMPASDRRPELSTGDGSSGRGRMTDRKRTRDTSPEQRGERSQRTENDRRRPDGGRRVRSDQSGGSEGSVGYLSRPWVRALVVFPAVVVGVSLLTSVYALGWSLGFSGTVFAFLGFALVRYPLTTVVSMVGFSAVNVIVATLRDPVLRATTEAGTPGPPAWAGVNVQAHLFGFLIGVVLGVLLLSKRDKRPSASRLLFATLLVVLARQLWALALGDDGVFYQYRAIGVVFVLLLSLVITVTVAVEDERLSELISRVLAVLAFGWLALVAVGSVAAIALTQGDPTVFFAVVAVTPLFAAPALPIVIPPSLFDATVSYRHLLIGAVLIITAIVALPSLVGNAPGIDGDTVPENSVAVGNYHVGYGEDVDHGRINSTDSGVVVVSEQRYVWTVPVTKQQLAHQGNTTVPVGGIGWRATVDIERTGWNVVGNDSVYTVDIEPEDERVRSFVSGNSTADLRVANKTITLVPTESGFRLAIGHDDTVLDTAPLPDINETRAAGEFAFSTEPVDNRTALFLETDDTRVLIAQKEES